MSGQCCPACGTAWLPDLRPACDCATRARAAAAAEGGQQPTEQPTEQIDVAEGAEGDTSLPPHDAVPADDPAPVFGVVTPPGAPQPEVNDADLELFDAVDDFGPEELRRSGSDGSGRGLRYGLLAGVTAVALVAVGITSGFFGGVPQGSSGTQARPQGDRESLEATGSGSPTPRESPSRAGRSSERPAAPSASTGSAGSTGPSRSASPTPSASASSDNPSSTPSSSASTSPEKPSSSETSPTPSTETSRTLRRGDKGDDVVELQRRLQELQLYVGPAHGNYNAEVEAAVERFQQARRIPEEPGVYGPATRSAVEAETSEPS